MHEHQSHHAFLPECAVMRAAGATVAAAAVGAAAAPPAIVLPAAGVCGKFAQEDVRLPVTDSFFLRLSAGAGAYRSAAASSMPCSSVGQNRSPLARRDSALSTRGDDHAYQLHSSRRAFTKEGDE